MEHKLATPSEIMDKIQTNIAIGENGCHIWSLGLFKGNPNLIWMNNKWEHVNVNVRRWVWSNKHGSIDPDVILIQDEKCHNKCCNIEHMIFEPDIEWETLCKHT